MTSSNRKARAEAVAMWNKVAANWDKMAKFKCEDKVAQRNVRKEARMRADRARRNAASWA